MTKQKRTPEDEAEIRRRRAQSQKDKARNQQQKEEEIIHRLADRITRVIQRLPPSATKPSSLIVPVGCSSISSQALIMEARSKKFMHDIAQVFDDAKYSDAKIVIHGVVLPVHKSVICTQSEYFQKAFQSAFVEGDLGILTFNEGSGAAYWRVFEYLYTVRYSDHLPKDFVNDSPLLKDPRMYSLADMFFLDDLKALSALKLKEKLQLEHLWTSDSFPDCVREVYSCTPNSDRGMRSAVVEVARAHTYQLGQKAMFRGLVGEGGDFAVDFIFPEPLDVPDDPPHTDQTEW
ncbi:hypothetical protein K458DRAFT_396581 [Lentithecium fluviatile CBS 122367]|uniref:BTB domain-containing protein n=1 Tax=Lentithecium fluviatile CBS 122367 TaxID=1168545 RepID=A0A6G1IG31_9PLEO|nr:hypothetical protein K458DRAFT_396581 [Lentithecium fluviatile CBS 122367]